MARGMTNAAGSLSAAAHESSIATESLPACSYVKRYETVAVGACALERVTPPTAHNTAAIRIGCMRATITSLRLGSGQQ
jgi:hypothetical protein